MCTGLHIIKRVASTYDLNAILFHINSTITQLFLFMRDENLCILNENKLNCIFFSLTNSGPSICRSLYVGTLVDL